MNIASAKGILGKSMVIALAAGAFAVINTPKAHAAQWEVGVQVGTPVYATTYPAGYYAYAPDYRDRARYEAYREHEFREAEERREAYRRHEYWEHERREHEYWDHHRDHDRDGWR